MNAQRGPRATESCLLIPVPDAELAVGGLRGRLDALTEAAHAAFPQCPPFGGIYPDVVPHLTIGARPPGGPRALQAAEADVLPTWLPARSTTASGIASAGGNSAHFRRA